MANTLNERTFFVVALMAFLLGAVCAGGAVHVSAGGAGDPLADGSIEHPYPTIQEGVEATTRTVLVAEGRYSEHVLIEDKTVHVLGGYDLSFTQRDPASHVTLIDGVHGVRRPLVEYLMSTAGSLDGFSIQGKGTLTGGGISCYRSSPTITNNIITDNRVHARRSTGGGMACWQSSPTITNNTITDNRAGYRGGGIECYESSLTLHNSILWGNSAPSGPELYLTGPSTLTVRYSNVAGGAAAADGYTLDLDDTNIDADPLFADPGHWDDNGTSDNAWDLSLIHI